MEDNSFKKLKVWNNAQLFGAEIYELCERNEFIKRDFSFKDQIKRAALSISNNIAEGYDYNNRRDFYRFLRYAKGSCAEVESCVCLGARVGYLTREDAVYFTERFQKLAAQIGKLMSNIRHSLPPKG